MGQADYFAPGDWNAVCSECGRKRKASQLEKNWQGLYRCPEHNEPRQPQDFVRGVKDDQSVPWAQLPASASTKKFVASCTINGQAALPGYAIPDCMVPGNSFFDPNGL